MYIANYPELEKWLGKAISGGLHGERIHIKAFFSDDPSKPRAYFTYTPNGGVFVYFQRNQMPLDQMISVIFECINSKRTHEFAEIFDQARSRAISFPNPIWLPAPVTNIGELEELDVLEGMVFQLKGVNGSLTLDLTEEEISRMFTNKKGCE